jgi:hypothetical protein
MGKEQVRFSKEAVIGYLKIFRICLEGLRKTKQSLSWDNQKYGLDSKRVLPKYKSRALPLHQTTQ